MLEFRFRTEHFEQDYTEWEQLKNRYERQTGTGQHTGSNTVEQDVGITATTPQTEREDAGYV